jgi:elongation factor P
MIVATDLKGGKTFLFEGKPYKVSKYTFTKVGRGGASVRVWARNLETGNLEEKSFQSTAKFEEIATRKRSLQYLYKDATTAYFMDPQSYEQVEISLDLLGHDINFVKEGNLADILFWSYGEKENIPLAVELPPKVTMKIEQTDPGVKGNSATNIYKPATLENGLVVKVPLFIKIGDLVRVDTRTGDYIERASE